jgi:regulator of sirC expression with transglutaminase-like and TPR domain
MMVHTHRESVARRWGDLFSRFEGTDGELLECGTLLLVEFYFPANDLLEATSPQELLLCVTSQIDSLVNDFRSRIDTTTSPNDPSKDVRSKIQLLNEFLFSEVGLRGNVDNYYDYRNSLLNHVLDTKQGIPLSLSALYVCICRCIGVEHVDMIGLPGHFLLEIPSDDALDNNSNSRLFIDVFNGGRFLSIQDCRDIVASYGYPWGEYMLEKVSPQLALKRMLNNLEHCHKHDKNMPLLMQLQLLRITERSSSNSKIMCEFLIRFPAVLFQESLSKRYLPVPVYLQVMHFFESQQLPNRH